MSASKAKRANAADKRSMAVALRLTGMDWQSIADQTGYASPGAACTAVSEALKARLKEQNAAADVMRETEAMRLDQLQAAVWPAAIEGDIKAIETVLKVIDRRAKLHGLDHPVRTEVTGANGGPLAMSTADPDKLAALIAATSRLDTDQPENTATSTPEDDENDEDTVK